MALERILIVRHGQTDWNIQGRWQGYEPVPLNDEGWAQARSLATALRGRPITAIYSSDLPRALQTASAIGDVMGVTPKTDLRLREFHLGIFQGHTRDEMIEKYPNEWQAFQDDYWNYPIPNGESRRTMQTRVHTAWEAITQEAAGPEAVIVSHGVSIRMLLLKLFADVAADLDVMHFNNTSVTTVERTGERWHLSEVASIAHLETGAVKSISEGS